MMTAFQFLYDEHYFLYLTCFAAVVHNCSFDNYHISVIAQLPSDLVRRCCKLSDSWMLWSNMYLNVKDYFLIQGGGESIEQLCVLQKI
jgi:hypothetical protein